MCVSSGGISLTRQMTTNLFFIFHVIKAHKAHARLSRLFLGNVDRICGTFSIDSCFSPFSLKSKFTPRYRNSYRRLRIVSSRRSRIPRLTWTVFVLDTVSPSSAYDQASRRRMLCISFSKTGLSARLVSDIYTHPCRPHIVAGLTN